MASFQVLYAEDEFTNRKLIEIQLSKSGISCDVASDGLQAYQKLEENSYEVVILDQYMPGLNGDQLARKILAKYPDLPLIAITSDDGEIDKLRSAGFREIFIKPLRTTAYIDILRQYLKT